MRTLLLLTLLAALAHGQAPDFRGGTRYVEVEVTVRHKPIRPPGVGEFLKWYFDAGPPFGPPGEPFEGLTRGDFTLLDDGKPQQIAVFGRESRPERAALPVPAGWVSNRSGAAQSGGTVLLLDLLNTPFDLLEYAKLGLREGLQSLAEADTPLAVYTLGTKFRVLHDLHDDPSRLRDTIRESLESGELPPQFQEALEDTGGLLGVPGGPAQATLERRYELTMQALHGILQHLSGVPGRKNLIWLSQDPLFYTGSLALIERANVALYPVMVRGAGTPLGTPGSMSNFQRYAVSGGRTFFDARDLTFAVQTATEDSHTHYVLGFYPPEESLDGRHHPLTVKISGQRDDVAEVHYRNAYVATKTPPAPVDLNFSLLPRLFDNPLEASGLGLCAWAGPDSNKPGAFRVQVTADLRDARLELQNGLFRGALEVAVPDPASPVQLQTVPIRIALTPDRYASALANGYSFNVSGVRSSNGEIHLIVRDTLSRVWGSLRFQPAAN